MHTHTLTYALIFETGSQHNPPCGCPITHYVDLAGLRLIVLPASASWELGKYWLWLLIRTMSCCPHSELPASSGWLLGSHKGCYDASPCQTSSASMGWVDRGIQIISYEILMRRLFNMTHFYAFLHLKKKKGVCGEWLEARAWLYSTFQFISASHCSNHLIYLIYLQDCPPAQSIAYLVTSLPH